LPTTYVTKLTEQRERDSDIVLLASIHPRCPIEYLAPSWLQRGPHVNHALLGEVILFIYLFIYLVIPHISLAPLQVHYYSEALKRH